MDVQRRNKMEGSKSKKISSIYGETIINNISNNNKFKQESLVIFIFHYRYITPTTLSMMHL